MSSLSPKVIFLTASYPTPEAPALGIFVKEHARAAAAGGADVAVVHLDRSDVARLRAVESRDEFPTLRIRYPRDPAVVSYAGNVAAAAYGLHWLRARGFRADVVHAHFFLAAIPAIVLRPLHRRPVLVTEQWSVFLPDDPATLSPLVLRAASFALRRADLVLPVSEALRDGIRAAGIDARFHVVPNVYDASLFRPPPAAEARNGRSARLLTVGALYEAKGYEYLLEAVALLARDRRDFRLDIVGDGELRSRYEDLRRRFGIEERVAFLGWRTKPEVAELMRRADLFVLTSRYDSNPCALIEALGTGLPVVATAVGGIPGMLEEGMGVLAEPRDPASIARALDAVLSDPGGFDRAAIAARARDRYGADRVGLELVRLYERFSRGGGS